jgi:membrane fusion protein, multidrug efflux system
MKSLCSRLIWSAAAALLLAACDNTESSSTAPAAPLPPEVTTVITKSAMVPIQRDLVGRLASTRVAEVRARVAGIILERTYTEGTDVEKGQVLFQIDPAPLKAELHATEAALARAKADATNATLIANRYRTLQKKGVVSTQDLDTALATERTTAAIVKQEKANVEKAQLDLSYATVTAPISGYAGRALATEGALVGEGVATKLTTIEQVDPMYVNFSQSINNLQQLRELVTGKRSKDGAENRAKVDVTLPDGTLYPHSGSLDFSDLSVDPATGAVSLRATVPNPDRQLLPGMFVALRITVGQLENAFLLPQASVLRDNAGAYVYVVNNSGEVEQRRVQTNGMQGVDWIVTGKLVDGEQVISAGLQKVKPGGKAKAVAAGTEVKPQAAAH